MASLKTLIVCLSSDLPSEDNRDPECIYFVYNTLELYMGKPLFGENFCIVDSMPTDEPNVDQVYICLDDGYVKVYDDYGTHLIAHIQSDEMLDVLRRAGTSYFFNSKERYIDNTDRTFVLPFNDGQFNMVVDFYEDTVIDETTIIKYNPETGHFEISSAVNNEALAKSGLIGGETDTAKITVDGGKIKGDVKISSGDGNIIKVAPDGIYAGVRNKVTQQEYNSWKEAISNYRVTLEASIATIEQQLEDLENIVSKEVVQEMVQEKLEEVIPFIEDAIMKYDALSNKVDEVLVEAEHYADVEVNEARIEIEEIIEEALAHPWGDLDHQSDLSDEDYAYVTLALLSYMESEGELSDEDYAYVSLALLKYIGEDTDYSVEEVK